MTNLLTLKNVCFQVSHPPRIILDNINYDIKAGDFIIILGSNGSGKSSLLKLIDRRYALTKGQLLFAGKSINSYSSGQLARAIITLTQNTQESLFCSLTVLENCLLAAKRAHVKVLRGNRMDYFKQYLAKFNPNLSDNLTHMAGSLSGGEQQALVLALASLARPTLLLLDEHTSALDPHSAEKLMQLTAERIQESGMTCLLTTHNLELAAKYGNRLLALQDGRIVRDYNAEQKERLSVQELKEQCYDVVAQ